MRAKILAELRKKFPGLSVEFLGLLAIQLESKVTEESQIEGVVTGLDNSPIPVPVLEKEFQKEGDKRVAAALRKWKEENPGSTDPKTDPKTDPTTDPKPGDPNAALLKEIREMRQEMTTLKTQQTQKSLSEKLIAKLNEKKIPVKLAVGRNLEKEEDLDTVLGEIESDYTELKQGLIDQGLLGTTGPINGQTVLKTDNADADIKAWSEKNKVKEPVKA